MNFIAALAHLARLPACFVIFFAQSTNAREMLGHATRPVPPLLVVAAGADADNTHGMRLACVSDLPHRYKEVHDIH